MYLFYLELLEHDLLLGECELKQIELLSFYNCLSCLCDYFLMLSFFPWNFRHYCRMGSTSEKSKFFSFPPPLPLSTKFLKKFYIICSNVYMPLCNILFCIQLIFKIYMFASFNVPMPVYFWSSISLFFCMKCI